MKKALLYILLILVAISLSAYFFGIKPLFSNLKEVEMMDIGEISLEELPDGLYTGTFGYARNTFVVEVTIKDSFIKNIELATNRETKRILNGKAVIDHVLREQTLQVDLVSGATRTSKAILKAIELALTQSP